MAFRRDGSCTIAKENTTGKEPDGVEWYSQLKRLNLCFDDQYGNSRMYMFLKNSSLP